MIDSISPATHPVHVFILEEKHICIHTMFPEFLNMLKPGAIAHCGNRKRGTAGEGTVQVIFPLTPPPHGMPCSAQVL